MKQDIAELKRNTDIVAVIGKYLSLKKDGRHFVCSCPFHSEKTSSFKITPSKQIYKCFGCGKAGDVIDFLIYYAGRSFQEAIQEIKDPNNTAGVVNLPAQVASTNNTVEWKAIEPRTPFKNPDATHYKHGKPSKIWYYRNAEGHIISLVCRFDLQDGKQVIPFSYCSNGQGREEWRWKGLEKPRPLYNLHSITMRPTEPVMIGEGEKTADAMHTLFIHHTSTTWIGGVEGVKHTDFSHLHGREIILWPDNDKEKVYKNGPKAGEIMPFHEQPGNKAMLLIYEILKPYCQNIKWVNNTPEFPCGWDVADASWTPTEAEKYLSENLIDVPVINNEVKTETKKIEQDAAFQKEAVTKSNEDFLKSLPDTSHPKEDEPDMKGGGHFNFLGYEKDVTMNLYHFYSYKSKTVISLSPSAMTKANILQLAPLDWWEEYFFRPKGGIEMDKVVNWLIERSTDKGVFNSKWIRGRGAWIDGKDVVIHTGNKLIVNGQPTGFNNYQSKYIYEIGDDMGFKTVEGLNSKESRFLIDLMKLMNWEREADAYLLAGWCVIAPMCGALSWRPHIWLTGPSGSGKSWVFDKIVRKLLGDSALAVQGETSEAGLRQMLKHDALPVVFDEAEGEDRKSQDRMADVLSLMRSASHSDGGIMAKGTSGGTAKTYRMRSCFAFASIAIQVTHQSDRTRVTIVSLKKPKSDEIVKQRWADLQKKYHSRITDEYAEKLRARTIDNLPVILKNAATFSSAAAAELGQQRTGDQIGILLAAAYSLHSHKEISYNKALEWIKEKDWSEEKGLEQTRDELALIQHILGQITRIESTVGVQERNIGELVRTAAGIHSDKVFDKEQANDRLMRLGMRVIYPHLIIGNSMSSLSAFLTNTHWAKNYNKILIRLEGASSMEATTFASGVKARATKIPISTLFDTSKHIGFGNGEIITGKQDDDLPF